MLLHKPVQEAIARAKRPYTNAFPTAAQRIDFVGYVIAKRKLVGSAFVSQLGNGIHFPAQKNLWCGIARRHSGRTLPTTVDRSLFIHRFFCSPELAMKKVESVSIHVAKHW